VRVPCFSGEMIPWFSMLMRHYVIFRSFAAFRLQVGQLVGKEVECR